MVGGWSCTFWGLRGRLVDVVVGACFCVRAGFESSRADPEGCCWMNSHVMGAGPCGNGVFTRENLSRTVDVLCLGLGNLEIELHPVQVIST